MANDKKYSGHLLVHGVSMDGTGVHGFLKEVKPSSPEEIHAAFRAHHPDKAGILLNDAFKVQEIKD